MTCAGILSDTHLASPDHRFQQLVDHCFSGCDTIIHAGDLTDLSVLAAFGERTVIAVHGNMCSTGAWNTLPDRLEFTLGRFHFGLTHGARLGMDIEAALWDVFPEADCVIYGHTHRPVCHRMAGRLIINPGSFQTTGRYGAPGTYAILHIGDTLEAAIHEVPRL